MTELEKMGAAAKAASVSLAVADTRTKNRVLSKIADTLTENKNEWLAANAEDIKQAKENGIGKALLDRLTLTEERIENIAKSIEELISLPDPIGNCDCAVKRPNGLLIQKRRVPLGVIGIIYEARPNVTVDAATLCLKSGNTCILRGGKEAFNSNKCAVSLMRKAIKECGLDENCVALIQDTSRQSATELMHLDKYIDVLIPRGGAGLIRTVAREASVPVIRTGEGVCHIYVEKTADIAMAAEVLYNAKCSRPSVCNAVECVVIDKEILPEFLAKAIPLLEKDKVQLRCDDYSLKYCKNGIKATEEDWDSEYDDYILAIKTVDNFDGAVKFISEHSTGHSECIMTSDYFYAERFLNEIDAAAVYVNASTRFTDGGEFGLGAEIGISTQKMHARGPMGLNEMTTYKYAVYGNGQTR